MKKEDEIVVVVPKSELFIFKKNYTNYFNGCINIKDSRGFYKIKDIMRSIDENYTEMRRGSVEETFTAISKNAELNTDYKQPIPYVVIRKGEKFFVTQRLEGGGESRLHGKLSMGVGGHMNTMDNPKEAFKNVLTENIQRELDEELYVEGNTDVSIIGLINDDSNDVGQVHIGILGVINLEENDKVSVRETEQLKGFWMSLDELREPENYSKLENWGKIVVDIM
ncbi:NUDIX domain-containing protein [Virgibacillus sp. M23]|uniref:NUDIX domain-containing protein n=1 Tax=Virgibacillus sp. M23 TaxID=3079030 RepID=UPI002A90CBFA|nr:NUDIX domain-containing protein [Virgibacillus sp. M23]MDY7043724.1 NUDIX domain-containing protein [Virgibacillus sp. M23]